MALLIPWSFIQRHWSKRAARRNRESISQKLPYSWSSRSGTTGARESWLYLGRLDVGLDEGGAASGVAVVDMVGT